MPALLQSQAYVVELTADRQLAAFVPDENKTAVLPAAAPTPQRELAFHPVTSGLADELLLDQAELETITDLLWERRQIVLYGPPGTGKTWLARVLARHLTDEGSVKLVQFHPSYTYEDFFEGWPKRLSLSCDLVLLSGGELRQGSPGAPRLPHRRPVDGVLAGGRPPSSARRWGDSTSVGPTMGLCPGGGWCGCDRRGWGSGRVVRGCHRGGRRGQRTTRATCTRQGAASDLGASRFRAFWTVAFPLSLPGVIAAFVFVLIPMTGEFIAPLYVGGPNNQLFGNEIQSFFGDSPNWNYGAVLAIALIVVVLVLMLIFGRFLNTDLRTQRISWPLLLSFSYPWACCSCSPSTRACRFLICFIASFDEFAIASFLAPPGQPTFPVFLYTGSRAPGLLPELIAIGSLIVVGSLVLIAVAEGGRRWAEGRLRGVPAEDAEIPARPGAPALQI